jgi:hypothetical protein
LVLIATPTAVPMFVKTIRSPIAWPWLARVMMSVVAAAPDLLAPADTSKTFDVIAVSRPRLLRAVVLSTGSW